MAAGKENKLPPIKYNGKIVYHAELIDIAYSCDNIQQWVEKQPGTGLVPIAFDMEWPFTYATGPGKSSVIQLCAELDKCFVFHILGLRKLPAALLALLYHPRVCLHGVNIVNDFRKLQRDFPEANAQRMIANCKDLGVWCNAVINSSGTWSLERLVAFICRLQISKDRRVRQSRWDCHPLTTEQRLYASIDVYISQVIYYDLTKREEAATKTDPLQTGQPSSTTAAMTKSTEKLDDSMSDLVDKYEINLP